MKLFLQECQEKYVALTYLKLHLLLPFQFPCIPFTSIEL